MYYLKCPVSPQPCYKTRKETEKYDLYTRKKRTTTDNACEINQMSDLKVAKYVTELKETMIKEVKVWWQCHIE